MSAKANGTTIISLADAFADFRMCHHKYNNNLPVVLLLHLIFAVLLLLHLPHLYRLH